MGDLDLSIGDTDKVLQEIYEGTKQIIQDNKIPFYDRWRALGYPSCI